MVERSSQVKDLRNEIGPWRVRPKLLLDFVGECLGFIGGSLDSSFFRNVQPFGVCKECGINFVYLS